MSSFMSAYLHAGIIMGDSRAKSGRLDNCELKSRGYFDLDFHTFF